MTRDSWTGAAPPSTAPAWQQKRGWRGRAEPDGSRQARHEASPGHRCPRHADWRRAKRRQPARQHDAGGHAGRRARRAGKAPWSATQASGQAARRQGIRSPTLPPGVPRPWHQAPHRTTWRGQQRPSRPAQVGGGTQLRLAGPLPAPQHPIRAPRRSPSRTHNTRLRRHLPAPDQAVLSLALSTEDCGCLDPV